MKEELPPLVIPSNVFRVNQLMWVWYEGLGMHTLEDQNVLTYRALTTLAVEASES